MPNDLTVPPEKQQELSQRSTTLASRIADLKAMPVSQVTAACGQELIQEAKSYLAGVHAVFDPNVEAAFKAHRASTQLRAKFLAPGEQADAAGRAAVRAWETERQRRLDAERREKERLAQLEAEKARAEELAHLQAQNVPTAIIEQRAADPIVVAAPDVDEDRGKVQGTSTVDRWTGVVVDMGAFLAYIAGIPGLHMLVAVVESALTRYLTSSKGQPIPGVTVSYDPIIRSKAG